MFNIFKKRTLDTLPKLNNDEIRKRIKILIIDDDPQSFPIDLFQKEGYDVTYWPKIQNLSSLYTNKYDIIILDVIGVADEYKSDGLEILKQIKYVNKAQLVIAFSGSRSVQTKEDFWKLSDGSLKKPIKFFTCKEYLDNFIDSHITINSKWNSLKMELVKAGLTTASISKIEKFIVLSIEKQSPFDNSILREELKDQPSLKVETILSIASSLYGLLK